MKTERRRMRHAALITGAVALASAAVAGSTAAAQAGSAAPAKSRQIASSTLGQDLKVTLTAVRSTADQYAASVRLATYTKAGGHWKLQDRVSVGKADSWFWFPLTGSQAVCGFTTGSSKPERIAVSLLVTPSIGCSAVHRYHVSDGRIVAD